MGNAHATARVGRRLIKIEKNSSRSAEPRHSLRGADPENGILDRTAVAQTTHITVFCVTPEAHPELEVGRRVLERSWASA
jgi:hypothetical protein